MARPSCRKPTRTPRGRSSPSRGARPTTSPPSGRRVPFDVSRHPERAARKDLMRLHEHEILSGAARPQDDNSRFEPMTNPISRRRALQVLGAVPVVGPLAIAEAQQQQPTVPHTTPQPPATATPQPPAGQAKHKFFTARELKIAAVLADDIIPRDEHSGSATDAGVLPYIDFHMSVPETTDEARVAMHGGRSEERRVGKE